MIKHLHAADDAIDIAKGFEKEADLQKAEKAYLRIIEKNPLVYEAYNRLLIIYRKQKEYRKELNTVNKAIRAFETNVLTKQKQWIKENKPAARLSKSLAQSLGLIHKNGLPVSQDPVLERWHKRKEIINRRLKKV